MSLGSRIRTAAALIALASLASADNHSWEIREIFSSADGTVQFIELFNPDKDENVLSETSLSTASGGFFSFPTDLSSTNTEGKRLLIATAAFAAIPGMPVPDYIIPAGFFSPLGDTIRYESTPSVVTFGALPSDGRSSISQLGAPSINSPTNFAGSSASVILATSSVRNGSGVNLSCYTATPPALGKLWTGSINVTGHPGAVAIALFGHAGQATGPMLAVGELLLNIASPLYFSRSAMVTGPVTNITALMPTNLALLGRTMATQALLVGGGTALCNAVDFQVGW